jgi:hypothetical protein
MPDALVLGVVGVLNMAAILAADPREDLGRGTMNMANTTQWTLATDDTTMKLAVASNRIFIGSLRNSGQNWEWAPAPSEVPLPGKDSIRAGPVGQTPDWTYRDATEIKSNGYTVVLRFTSSKPALELKSHWKAFPGPGPVENWVTIENKSGTNVTYTPGIVAGMLRIKADKSLNIHRADKTAVGTGKVHFDPIGANAKLSTGTGQIPFIMLVVECDRNGADSGLRLGETPRPTHGEVGRTFQVSRDALRETSSTSIASGSGHGLYLGFEWELGGFQVAAGTDPLNIGVSVCPITGDVSRGPNEIFDVPSVYYGAYKGDIDDGANRFKRWFWNHKITRSLHDNPGEPWVEVCMQDLGGKGSSSITGLTPQNVYDRLAATGAECAKMDFWDGSGQCWYTGRDWTFKPAVWPNGFDFAAKAHKAGLRASLYMGGTYNDADLTTIAGRDAELAAVLERFDKGWFDMWRTDLYTAPREPMPQTYEGVKNFLYIHDQLIAKRPGYRYENCCNGGKYKGFAICRRMTFCTMNDIDHNPVATRTTYYANTFAINPVQLKSDLGPAQTPYQLRTHMLGAILSWATDNPVYREHIALYKARQRPILRGANVYHILPMPDGRNWDGLQFHNPDLNRGSVFLFKPSAAAVDGDSKVIKLKGLDRKATYSLTFQDRTHLNCSTTGAQLMDEGITVSGMTGDLASEIIWINCPCLSAEPAKFGFVVDANGTVPSPQKIAVRYKNGANPSGKFMMAADAPWVRIAPVSGSGDGQVFAVSVNPQGIASGIVQSRVTISREDMPDTVSLPVTMRIQGEPRAANIEVAPAAGRTLVGGTMKLAPTVQDQFGEPLVTEIAWTVSGGGAVDGTGLFTGGLTPGESVVTAAVKGTPSLKAAARIKVCPVEVAYWKLDEAEGATAADSWGKNTATLVGGPAWVPGKKGGALRFNGENQYLDAKTHFPDLNIPFSIAFWVNPADMQVSHANIFGHHVGSNVGMVLQQEGDKVNQYSFGYGATPQPGGAGPIQLDADMWQHVGVVCDGTNVVLYLKGVEKARGPGRHPMGPNPGMTFRLGQGYQGGGRFFSGALDDFRIYARALSAAEVDRLAAGAGE